MDSSRALALRRALRPASRAFWPGHVRLALAMVTGRPTLWLLGALGFTLRGGIVLLTVPMLVLPTLGETRLLLGDNLGTNGFKPDLLVQLALGAGVLAVLGLAATVLLAHTETDAFATHTPRSAAPTGARRRRLLVDLVALQLAALVVLALAAMPLVGAVYAAAVAQIVYPTGSGDIYVRVLGDVRWVIAAFVAVAIAVEMLTALLMRARLRAAFGLGAFRTMALLGQPVRAFSTALVGWTVSAVTLLPSAWLIGQCFDRARAAFLAPPSGEPLGQAIGQVGLSVMLVLAVLVAIVVTGFSSAVRAALWNAESLG